MSTPSRKRKVLTFEEKLDIVQRLENNEKASDIAAHYDIGKSTVHEIMRNRKQLFEFCSSSLANEGMTKRRRVMRRPTNEYLEKCMHIWYIQERIKGLSITGPMITRKASFFDHMINGENTNFKASSGWLFRFKQRCGIAHLHAQLDLNAVMQKDISVFQERLKALIRGKNLLESQVYYACEVRLSWKSLPEKVVQKLHPDMSDVLSSQERLTFLLCVNGTGSHKLPLLVIANPGTDTSQPDTSDLPSRLVSTDDACLDPVILKNWFTNGFIPAVKAESDRQGVSQNAVLILESSPAHPFATDELSTDGGAIQAIFLPPNCTNTKLSLCSGLPDAFKKEYRYAQVKKAFGSDLSTTQKENLMRHYTETFNLETALQLSVDAWADTKQEDIITLWDEFFKNLKCRKSDNEGPRTKVVKEKQASVFEKIMLIFAQHEIFKDTDLQNIKDWVEKMDNFLLFPVLTDEEIIEKVRREIAAPSLESDSPPKKKRKPSYPSDTDAVGYLDKCISWLKNQADFSPEDVKTLRTLKQKARDNMRNAKLIAALNEMESATEQGKELPTYEDSTAEDSNMEAESSMTSEQYSEISFQRSDNGDLIVTGNVPVT